MKRFRDGLLLVILLLPALAMSANKRVSEVRKSTEISTLMTGTIVVDEKGQVSRFQIDEREKFTPTVVDFVEAATAEWDFEPLSDSNGKPATARNKFSLRLAAQQQDDGTYSVRIAGVDFRPYAEATVAANTELRVRERVRLKYPETAAYWGAHGTVYVVVKVAPDGKVIDAVVSQVNLRVVADERDMEMLRKAFAQEAVRGLKKWRMDYPAEGEQASKPYLLGSVTIDFRLNGDKAPEYGQWEAYIPGPRVPVPWPDLEQELPGYSPDAVAGDGIRLAGEKGALKLLTPLQG